MEQCGNNTKMYRFEEMKHSVIAIRQEPLLWASRRWRRGMVEQSLQAAVVSGFAGSKMHLQMHLAKECISPKGTLHILTFSVVLCSLSVNVGVMSDRMLRLRQSCNLIRVSHKSNTCVYKTCPRMYAERLQIRGDQE